MLRKDKTWSFVSNSSLSKTFALGRLESQVDFGSKKFGVQKNFLLRKRFSSKKRFVSKKNVWSEKNVGSKKFDGPKKILV